MASATDKHDTRAQALFIITTGRRIHEEILNLQSRHLANLASPPHIELSLAQFNAIGVVRSQGPLTMGDLADRLGISAPSASAMVDRLTEKGLLQREPSTEDRRKVVVRIAPDAKQDIDAIEAGLLALFEDLVQKLGPKTTDQWCRVLAAVQKVLLSETGPPAVSGNSPAGP